MNEVQEYLTERGIPFELVPHGSSDTSVGEALALGVRADEVLKAILIHTSSGPAIVVIPADERVDMLLVRGAVADHHARLATEAEIRRDFPQFELGALPPIGSLFGARTLLDPEILWHDRVSFAAGSRTLSVTVRTEDVFRAEPVQVVPLVASNEEDKQPIR